MTALYQSIQVYGETLRTPCVGMVNLVQREISHLGLAANHQYFCQPCCSSRVMCPPCFGNRVDSNRVDKTMFRASLSVIQLTYCHRVINSDERTCISSHLEGTFSQHIISSTVGTGNRGDCSIWKHAYVPSMKEHCSTHRSCRKLPLHMIEGPTQKRHLAILF